MWWNNRTSKPSPFVYLYLLYSCQLNIFRLASSIIQGMDTINLTWVVWIGSPFLGWCFSCFKFHWLFTSSIDVGRLYILCYTCENLCSEQFSVFPKNHPTDIHWLIWLSLRSFGFSCCYSATSNYLSGKWDQKYSDRISLLVYQKLYNEKIANIRNLTKIINCKE